MWRSQTRDTQNVSFLNGLYSAVVITRETEDQRGQHRSTVDGNWGSMGTYEKDIWGGLLSLFLTFAGKSIDITFQELISEEVYGNGMEFRS